MQVGTVDFVDYFFGLLAENLRLWVGKEWLVQPFYMLSRILIFEEPVFGFDLGPSTLEIRVVYLAILLN